MLPGKEFVQYGSYISQCQTGGCYSREREGGEEGREGGWGGTQGHAGELTARQTV